MLDNANSEVNVMKVTALETVPIPYILPFVQTELRDTRHKFTCWKLVMDEENADFAAVSAFSLPPMLTWLDIQHKVTVLPLLAR